MVYLFVFLHILTMFAAVSFAVLPDLVIQRAAQARDVRALKSAFMALGPFGRIVPFLFLLGAVFGLIAAYAGYNLLQRWLILAYVIYVIALGLDGGLISPWRRKTARAVMANAGDKPSAELDALLDNRLPYYAMWANNLAIVLIILVMVFKPLGA